MKPLVTHSWTVELAGIRDSDSTAAKFSLDRAFEKSGQAEWVFQLSYGRLIY